MTVSEPYTLICATACNGDAFTSDTPLGQSLDKLAPLLAGRCNLDIVYENTSGLSQVYNHALQRARANGAQYAIFVHDDVRIDDGLLLNKLDQAFSRFDIVGVAGPRALSVNTPIIGWGVCPRRFQAGWVTHPIYDRMDSGLYADYFGPAPMPTVALDGVFIAARIDRIGSNPFDTQFTFDFYDLDFSLSQHLNGCNVGVWPIQITHFSKGQGWKSARFKQMQESFRAKYGGVIRRWNLPKKWWVLKCLRNSGVNRPAPPQGEFIVSYRKSGWIQS
jgi:GT2 family glycosyltransferase